MTATVVPQTRKQRETKHAELVARAKAVGWRGQNELARRCGKDPGHFSRVMRGLMVSTPVWIEAERVLSIEEAQCATRRPTSDRKAS